MPLVLGILIAILTRRVLALGIGATWFLSALAAFTAIETFHSVRNKLPGRKRDALACFLQTGGYSLAAASMAAYFACFFWTSYRPNWLMRLMFTGIFMFLSSGFVYIGHSRKPKVTNGQDQ